MTKTKPVSYQLNKGAVGEENDLAVPMNYSFTKALILTNIWLGSEGRNMHHQAPSMRSAKSTYVDFDFCRKLTFCTADPVLETQEKLLELFNCELHSFTVEQLMQLFLRLQIGTSSTKCQFPAGINVICHDTSTERTSLNVTTMQSMNLPKHHNYDQIPLFYGSNVNSIPEPNLLR